MKNIVFIAIITAVIMQSCEIDDPTPPCSFDTGVSMSFLEMQLDWGDASNIADWDTDHNSNNQGYTSTFENILDYNSHSANDNATVDYTVTGNECDGVATVHYDRSDGISGMYYSNTLNGAPQIMVGYVATVELRVRSAEYNETGYTGVKYVCYWETKYLEVQTNNFSLQSGLIEGQWQPVSKSGDNGKPKRVYVNDQFNNYIYTI